MKNSKYTLLICAITLTSALAMQNCALASDNDTVQTKKYAVVDVKKVVNNAKSVKTLKEERQEQKEAVEQFIKDGNAQIKAEKDKKKQTELRNKLNNDLKYMTQTYEKRYKENLLKVNKEILTEISEIGKAKHYDLILTTDAVLYGGEDITKEVIKEVK